MKLNKKITGSLKRVFWENKGSITKTLRMFMSENDENETSRMSNLYFVEQGSKRRSPGNKNNNG